MNVGEDDRGRLRTLVEGSYLAPAGTSGGSEVGEEAALAVSELSSRSGKTLD